jgi:hypothetical protein
MPSPRSSPRGLPAQDVRVWPTVCAFVRACVRAGARARVCVCLFVCVPVISRAVTSEPERLKFDERARRDERGSVAITE